MAALLDAVQAWHRYTALEVYHTLRVARGERLEHWRRLLAQSPLVGQTLAEADLRAQSGASVIVIIRAGQTLPNPKSSTRFMGDDLIGVIGDTAQITCLDAILGESADTLVGEV